MVDAPGFNLDTFSFYKTSRYAYMFHTIPGIIEAENYDAGGEGVAYHDSDYLNRAGSTYRAARVDVGSNENGPCYVVGYISGGEWLEYIIANVETGIYDIDIEFAGNDNQGGKAITVSLDGSPLGTVNPWNTGGWNAWQTATIQDVYFEAGTNAVLILAFSGENFNINRLVIDNNQLENSDFSWNLDHWTLGTYDGASATIQNNGGQMLTTINGGGTQNWNVQITQAGLTVETGKTYIVSFDATAESNRIINVNVGMAGDPYTSYGGTDITLSTFMTSYTYTFTMTQPTDNNARFEFNLGTNAADVTIDNVSLEML